MGFAAAATSSAGPRASYMPSNGLGAEQIRVRQASNCCMTSREAGYVPWKVDGPSAQFNSEYDRFGLEKHNSTSRKRGKQQHSQRWKARQAMVVPMCLIGGLGGSFWDGSDTDSSASDRFLPKRSLSNKSAESSVLLSLIQEIEPLDMSLIGKDASPAIMDAMKRTISGMLGLLPSDQFQVTVQTEREPLAKLLVSGMMTGYTLRNAEYRLSLQRSLDLPEDECGTTSISERLGNTDGVCKVDLTTSTRFDEFNFDKCMKPKGGDLPEHLGELSPEVAKYIESLQSKLDVATAELAESRRSYAALEMEMIGEEKNDLLDYLRSLEPTKVAELSKVASPEVEEVVQQVIDGLLGSLTPVHKGPGGAAFNAPLSGAITSTWKHEDGETTEAVTNIPLQFESTVTASRDYVARLLFWCMLLGHYMRGIEYRLDLTRTFSLSSGVPVTSAGSCPSEETLGVENLNFEIPSHVEIVSETNGDAGNV